MPTPSSPSPSERLSATDAVMWEIEHDPVLRSPILVVGLLDGVPEADAVRSSVERTIAAMPRLRQRITSGPGGLDPRWVDDPSFSLDYHLRRVRAPHPASLRTVLDLAEPILSAGFDRERPLWELTVVEDVEGGRGAFILKVHHSLTDGVGGIALATVLFDPSPEGPDDTQAVVVAPVSRDRGHPFALLQRALLHPTELARDTVHNAASLGRLLAPVTEPLSPIMRGRSLLHRLDVIDVGLDDLARAGRAAGGTINDAFLAAVAGGLGRYHHQFGASVAELRVTMPVDLRVDTDPMGGNRFAPVRFELPVNIDDPARRIQRVAELAHRWRDDPALGFTESIAAVISLLPPVGAALVLGSMFRAVDLDVTNVAGMRTPVWLAGIEVTRMWAFAPPTGAALSVTLLSHVDRACIGIEADDEAVDDPRLLTECLVAAIDEVVSLAAPRGASSPAGSA